MKIKGLFFIVILSLFLGACYSKPPVNRDNSKPLEAVSFVDIDRYLGLWYEIARFPNDFEDRSEEERCEAPTAEYSLLEEGKLEVVNTCFLGSPQGRELSFQGKARVADTETNAKLKIRFFSAAPEADYWVIILSPSYRYAVIGEPEGRYLWILSRTPTLPQRTLSSLISQLKAMGYKTDALYYPRHK